MAAATLGLLWRHVRAAARSGVAALAPPAGAALRHAGRLAWLYRRGLFRAGLAGLGLGLAGFAAAAVVEGAARWLEAPAGEPAPMPAALPQPAATPYSDWRPMPKVAAVFDTGQRDLAGLDIVFTAERDAASGARQDRFVAGTVDGDGPHLDLALRGGAGVETERFYVAMARRAAGRGLALGRAGATGGVATKFGTVEAADIVIESPAGASGPHSRPCLAFRHRDEASGLAIDGWLCGTRAAPADRRALACLLDRVMLVGGGGAELRGAFARAERQRLAGCRPSSLLAAGHKPKWLDAAQAAPTLKPSTAAPRPAAEPAPRRQRVQPPPRPKRAQAVRQAGRQAARAASVPRSGR